MASYDEIDEARKVLGLAETATLQEIKSAYWKLARRHHPDMCGSGAWDNDAEIKEINRAYKLLMDYCAEYRYSFQEEAVARTYPNEEAWKKWRENWGM